MAEFPVTKTDEEWKRILTPEQYQVLRQHATERPGSCALNTEKRAGHVLLRGLRAGALHERHEVQFRHRLAELLRAEAWRDRHHRRIARTA